MSEGTGSYENGVRDQQMADMQEDLATIKADIKEWLKAQPTVCENHRSNIYRTIDDKVGKLQWWLLGTAASVVILLIGIIVRNALS